MMSSTQYLSVKERQSSLSSVYSSSMESLSSSHGADSYWSIDQELALTSTAYTIPQFRAKTSDYDTGFSTAEFDEEKKYSKKSGRVRKVFNLTAVAICSACVSYSYKSLISA